MLVCWLILEHADFILIGYVETDCNLHVSEELISEIVDVVILRVFVEVDWASLAIIFVLDQI